MSSKYVRNAEGQYVCPDCGKITAHQNTMYYHIKKEHTKDLPYECKLCTNKFLQKSSYLHHLATMHPDTPHDGDCCSENPYAGVKHTCPCCEHSSHTKANIRIHFARSHAKAWIPAFDKTAPSCTGCGKVCASSSAYLYHALDCFKAPLDYSSMVERIK